MYVSMYVFFLSIGVVRFCVNWLSSRVSWMDLWSVPTCFFLTQTWSYCARLRREQLQIFEIQTFWKTYLIIRHKQCDNFLRTTKKKQATYIVELLMLSKLFNIFQLWKSTKVLTYLNETFIFFELPIFTSCSQPTNKRHIPEQWMSNVNSEWGVVTTSSLVSVHFK